MGVLEILIVVVLLLWLFGAIALPLALNGGEAPTLIHVLLIVVLVLVIVRLVRGRSVL